MTLRLITPPAGYPISLAEARDHLRVDHSEDDALISGLIAAAFAYAEQTTGRSFVAQTWEQVLDAFPAAEIDLQLGPVSSVTSVIYIDADGDEQTLDAAAYSVNTVSPAGLVSFVDAWPATSEAVEAVVVRFAVGGVTPLDVRQAVLLILGLWYDTRAAATESAMAAVPMGAEIMLSLHRRLYV